METASLTDTVNIWNSVMLFEYIDVVPFKQKCLDSVLHLMFANAVCHVRNSQSTLVLQHA